MTPQSGPRILLVEDDEDLLQVFATALRAEKYAVWVARDGTQAMEISEELGWDADVIVVDLELGEGPRGDQFVAYYRTRQKRDPSVVVVSGAPRAQELARRLGVSALLSKPLGLDEFMRTVGRFARPLSTRDGEATA